MAEPTTATPTALDRLQLQLDTAQLTLLTAAGQAAGQTPSVGGNAIVLTSASSPATIKQEIESRAIQDMSPWKALGDRVFVVFVPKFREKGLIFEPIVKTQRGSLLDLCKQRNHATHILAGNASFFGLPDDATDLRANDGDRTEPRHRAGICHSERCGSHGAHRGPTGPPCNTNPAG